MNVASGPAGGANSTDFQANTWALCAWKGAAGLTSPVALGLIDTKKGTVTYRRTVRSYELNEFACHASTDGKTVAAVAAFNVQQDYGESYLIADYHGSLREMRIPNQPKQSGYELNSLSPNGRFALLVGDNPNARVPLILADLARRRLHIVRQAKSGGFINAYWAANSSLVAYQTVRGVAGILRAPAGSVRSLAVEAASLWASHRTLGDWFSVPASQRAHLPLSRSRAGQLSS